MVMSYGTEEYVDNKKKLIRYNFFRDERDGGRDAVFGLDIPLMSVNLSLRQLQQYDIVQSVRHVLAETGDRIGVVVHRGKIVEVGARAEGLVRAEQHQHAHVAALDSRDLFRELGPPRRRNGVARFRPIERQPGIIIVSLEKEHEAGMARMPGFVAQKRPGCQIRGGPAILIRGAPSGGGEGPRANVGAITTAPRPVEPIERKGRATTKSCGFRWLTCFRPVPLRDQWVI